MTEEDLGRASAPDLPDDLRLALAPRARFRRIEGEAVLLELDRGHYFHLNETGTAAWLLFAEGATLAQACAELAQRYQTDLVTVRREVSELVASLLEERLASVP